MSIERHITSAGICVDWVYELSVAAKLLSVDGGS